MRIRLSKLTIMVGLAVGSSSLYAHYPEQIHHDSSVCREIDDAKKPKPRRRMPGQAEVVCDHSARLVPRVAAPISPAVPEEVDTVRDLETGRTVVART